MNNPFFKTFAPHLLSLVAILVAGILFFSPYVFDGKVLDQHDINQATASQAEMTKYKAETGKSPLWTNAYFAGMPTAQIHFDTDGNLTAPLFRALMLKQPITAPHAAVILAMLSMYLLLNVMRIDWRLSLVGALGFGISTFNMDIIAAGHSTKMVALALAPGVLAGALLAFRGRIIIGSALFALFTAFEIFANHYQITYYTFLILLILGISELVAAIQRKALWPFGQAALGLLVGLMLGIGSNLTTLWITNEYQTESTRGKTALSAAYKKAMTEEQGSAPSSDVNGGLSPNYAFMWSYGIGETMTLLAQNVYGGGASQSYEGTEAESLGNLTGLLYMGKQPYVGVAIYYGAVFVFLFIMGMFLLENRWRWGLLASTVLMIGIAWGNNSPIALALFDYFPLFNKFRAHTQALGLGQLLAVLVGMMTLHRFFDKDVATALKQKSLYAATGITAALCLLAMAGSTTGGNDAKMIQDYGQQVAQALPKVKEARAALMQADAVRSLLLVLGAAGILFFSLRGWLKSAVVAVSVLGLLSIGDVWVASRRVIYEEKFQEPRNFQKDVQPTAIDKEIMKDPDPHYRVLDLRKGPNFYENANTSRFHKSVGGYHAAKMMIYQEMVEKYLGKFEQLPINQQKNLPLFGMLNAKYIIVSDEAGGAVLNPTALGNAWFVKNVRVVDNADQELDAVGTINPKYDVVVQKSFADKLSGAGFDSTAQIKLTSYHPDKLTYTYTSSVDQVAVFSEIYYPEEKGWSLTIDGQPAHFAKANYLLRAAKLPAGTHNIEMRFEPKSYYTGEKISLVASALLLLALLLGLVLHFRKNGLPEPAVVADLEVAAPTPIGRPTPEVSKAPEGKSMKRRK